MKDFRYPPKNVPAPSGITYTSRNLSPELIEEVEGVFWLLYHKNWFSLSPDAAEWNLRHGKFVSLPQCELLRMVELEYGGASLSKVFRGKGFKAEIADEVAGAVEENDAEYFEILAKLLRFRREGTRLASLSWKSLGLKSRKGRKATAYDLSRAVPLAVEKLLARRVRLVVEKKWYGGQEFTTSYLTRDELRNEIQAQQLRLGMAAAQPLRETDLSRWIGRMGIGKFVIRGTRKKATTKPGARKKTSRKTRTRSCN